MQEIAGLDKSIGIDDMNELENKKTDIRNT